MLFVGSICYKTESPSKCEVLVYIALGWMNETSLLSKCGDQHWWFIFIFLTTQPRETKGLWRKKI